MFGSSWGQNTQRPSGFGTSTGFGQQQPQQQNTGFGQTQNTGGGLFGSTNTNTAATSTFGGGGFGAAAQQPQTNTFGRPGFGATGSSTFGQPAATTSGGLFGSSTPASTFGATNASTSGGLFGAKPATTGFGASAGTGVFGGGGTTSTFGGNAQMNPNQVFDYRTDPPPPVPQSGTLAPPYMATWQRDPSIPGKEMPPHLFHVISAMEPYRGASFEELRMLDYQQGRKEPTPGQQQPAATGFGQPAAGGFGQPAAAATSTFGQTGSTAFGAKPAGTGLFGGSTGTTGGFGSTASTGFGQPAATNTGSGLFGQQNTASTGGFGQTNTNTTGGLFGQPQQASTTSGGLFGNTATTNPSPFGAASQPQQSSGFGGFGAAAAKPAFGATTSTTGFGQTGTTNAFGQPSGAASTGFGGFGQNAQQQQQQQPQQQTSSLFGGGASTFGQNTANTGSSLFGQNTQQQNTASGGLFGNTAAKPAGTGLFGAPAASTATTGGFGGGFGQSTAAQPTSGLFGQPAANAAQPTTTGLFGAQNNTATNTGTGLFGAQNTANTGSTLFGAKPATTTGGGLFGTTPAAPAATGTTGFGGFGQTGQAAAGTGTGLFGNTGANTAANQFGAKPAGSSIFGGGTSSLFGAQAGQQPAQQNTGGGLFNTMGQSTTGATSGLFGSGAQPQANNALGQSSLFGSTLGASTAQQQQQQNLTGSVDQNPYGRNELFQYNGQKLDLSITAKRPAMPPLTASTFRVTPTKGRVTKLRGFSSSLNASQSSPRASSPSIASPRQSLIGSPAPSDRYKGLTEEALSPNAFIPRPSVKKITVAPRSNGMSGDDPLESVLGKSPLRRSANGASPAPTTPDLSVRSPALAISNGRIPSEDTPTRRAQPTPAIDSSIRAVTDRPLKHGDYWCRPKLEKLRQMSHDELSHLDNFSAGRKGYGEVTFLDPVDLTTLSSLQDLLGKTITVEDLELTVYENEQNKPERGKGLNVPAEISLENCFTRDKATRKPVTDPSDPRYQRQLKRMKMVPDTEFIGFSSDGVWTFKVEHFSKYGLVDSDDESDEGVASPTPPPKSLSRTSSEEEDMEDDDDDFLPPTKSMHDADMLDPEHDSGLDEEDEYSLDEDMDGDYSDDTVTDLQPEWDQPLKAKLGAEGVRKLREMQSSFFGAQEAKAPRLTAAQAKRAATMEAARALERKRDLAGFGDAEEGVTRLDDRAVKRASFGQPASPPKPRQARKYAKVPLADSTVNGNEGLRPDAGFALGRSFRCSWGPNGELVHFGKICAPGASFTSSPDAVVYIQPVELLAEPKEVERPRAERLLSLVLENTEVEQVDGVPTAFTDTSIRFRQFAELFDAGDRSHEASIWRLGQALFDEIDLGLPDDTPDEVRQRVAEVRRKLALSKWLEDAVAPVVDSDLAAAGDNRPAKVFTLLTGNQTDRAVQSALDGKDMRLATLVSQVGGPDVFRAEVARQLEDWTKFKANAHIGYDYRKLYALFAGVTDISPGDSSRGPDHASDVLVAEGLDWKRAFGLQLWHGCYFEQPIADVLESYNAALESAHPPARPLPPYLESPDGGKTWKLPTEPTDVLFNLIEMYADLTVSLDRVLPARDMSPSPTDVRLPWHLYLLLSYALAKRDFADREEADTDGVKFSATANAMTASYAAQLEEEGQWTWAAFVLLHLEREESRRDALRDLLFRHPDPSAAEQAFLTDKLRIPEAWLHEARAASLASSGDAYREYFALIAAGLADRAQDVLLRKLAPEAVLRDDATLLRRLCEALEPLRPSGWEFGGQLLVDYLDLTSDVRPLLQGVLRAGAHPDPHEARTLADLAQRLPRALQLLPALFPDAHNVQQVAGLSDMLSSLQALAAPLHAAGYVDRPPVSDLLVDKDRLHLLQGAATESFEKSLQALTAA